MSPSNSGVLSDIRHVLAPRGILRAGVNLSNFLLVSSRTTSGEPDGVSPDMARAIAMALGVDVSFVTYPSPALLADAAVKDEWDIGLIGAEPQRSEVITFTQAYAEIEATYLVQPNSEIRSIADVDKPNSRIAVTDRTAYGLWLDRNIVNATLVRSNTFDDSLAEFRDQKLDALAGIRPRLIFDEKAIPGSRILSGAFMTVQQAIGVPKPKQAATGYLMRFVDEAKASGLVSDLIRKHGVHGLGVAGSGSGR